MKFINFLNEVKFFDIKTPIYDKNYIVKLMKNFNEYWEELNVEENNSSNLNKIKEKLNNIKNTEPVDEPKSSFRNI